MWLHNLNPIDKFSLPHYLILPFYKDPLKGKI